MNKLHFLKVVLILLGVNLLPQREGFSQQTSIDLEFRFNPSYSMGFRRPLYAGEEPGFFTLQRSRLILNYQSDKIKSELIVQDRRAWGESNNGDFAELSLFRGWAEVFLTPELSLKIGRQGLVYDDQHLFAYRNWAGVLSHDGIVAKYEKENFKAHLVLAQNATKVNEFSRAPYTNNFYKSLQILWVHKDWKNIKSSFILVNKGDEKADTTVNYLQTFGSNTSIRLSNKLSLKGIYYHQVGKDDADRKVDGQFWSAQVIYNLSDKLKLNAGVETLSGTDAIDFNDPANPTSSSFDRHFAPLHGDLGYMDLLYVLVSPVFGIHDYYLKADYGFNKKWTIVNHMHWFYADESVYEPLDVSYQNPINKFVGFENDFMVRYRPFENVDLSTGYSVMWGTRTLDVMFGGDDIKRTQFIYAVLTVKPRIFEKTN